MKIKLSLAAVLTCSVVYGDIDKEKCYGTSQDLSVIDRQHTSCEINGIWTTCQIRWDLIDPFPPFFVEKISKLGECDRGVKFSGTVNASKDSGVNGAFCNAHFVSRIGPAIANGHVELSVADILYSPGYAYTLAYDGYKSYDRCDDRVGCKQDAAWNDLNPGNNCKNPLWGMENIKNIALNDRRSVDYVNIVPQYSDLGDDLHNYYDKKIIEKYGTSIYKSYGLKSFNKQHYNYCFNGYSTNGCDDAFGVGRLAKFTMLDYGYKTSVTNNPQRLVGLNVRANHKSDETLESGVMKTLNGMVMKSNDIELTEDIYKLNKPKQYSTGVIETYVYSSNNKGLTYFITQDAVLPTDKGQYFENLIRNGRDSKIQDEYFRKKHSGKSNYIQNINVSASKSNGYLHKNLLPSIQVDFDTLGILAPKYFESVFFKLPNKSTGVTQGYDGAYKTDVYVQHGDWLNRYITGFGTIRELDRTKVDPKTSVYDGGWFNHRYLKNPSYAVYSQRNVSGAMYWESDIKDFGLAYDMYDPITTFIPGDPAYGEFSYNKDFVYKQYAIDDASDTHVDLHIRPLFAQVKSDGQGGYIAEHQNNINKTFGNGGFNYNIKYVFYPDPNGAIGYRKPDFYKATVGEQGNATLVSDGSMIGTEKISDFLNRAQSFCSKDSLACPLVDGMNGNNHYKTDYKNGNIVECTVKPRLKPESTEYNMQYDFYVMCTHGYKDTQSGLNDVKDSMTETTFNEIKGLDEHGNVIRGSLGAPIFKLTTNGNITPARKQIKSCSSFDNLESCLSNGDIVNYNAALEVISATYKNAYVTSGNTTHYSSVTVGNSKKETLFSNPAWGGDWYVQDFATIKHNLSETEKHNSAILRSLLGKKSLTISYEKGAYVGYLKLGSELNNFIQEDDSPLVLEATLGNILDEKTGRIVALPGKIKIIIKGFNAPVTPEISIATLDEYKKELDTIATQVHNKVVDKDNPNGSSNKSTSFRFKQDFGVDQNPNNGQYVKIILQKKTQNNDNGGWGKGENLGNIYFKNKCVDKDKKECSNTTNEVINSSNTSNEVDKLKGFNKSDGKVFDFTLDNFNGVKNSIVYENGHSSNDLGVGVYRFAIIYDYIGSTKPSEPVYSDEFTIRPEYVSMALKQNGKELKTLEANKNYATSNIKSADIAQAKSMTFETEFSFEKGVESKDLTLLNNKDLNEFYYVVPMVDVGLGNSASNIYGGFRMDLISSNKLQSIKTNNITLNVNDKDKLDTKEVYVKVPYRADNFPFAYKINFVSAKEAQSCDMDRPLSSANIMKDGKYGCSPMIVKDAKNVAFDPITKRVVCEKPYAGITGSEDKMMCSNVYKTTAINDVACKPVNDYGFFRTRFNDDFEKAFSFITMNGYNVVYGCVHKYSALDEATNTMVPIYGLSNQEIEKTAINFFAEGVNKKGITFSVMEANGGAFKKESQIRENIVFGGNAAGYGTNTKRDKNNNPVAALSQSYYDDMKSLVKVVKDSGIDFSSFPTNDIAAGYGKGGITAINGKMGDALTELLGYCKAPYTSCAYDPITLSPTRDYNAEVSRVADIDSGVSGIGNNFRVGITKERVKTEPIYIVDNTTTDKTVSKVKAVLKYATLEPEDAVLDKPITDTTTIVSVDDKSRVKIYEGGVFKNLEDDKSFSSSKLADLNLHISKYATLKETPILSLGLNNNGGKIGYDIKSKDKDKTSKSFKELSVLYFEKDKDLGNILQPLNANVKIIYDPKDNKNDWRGVGIGSK